MSRVNRPMLEVIRLAATETRPEIKLEYSEGLEPEAMEHLENMTAQGKLTREEASILARQIGVNLAKRKANARDY